MQGRLTSKFVDSFIPEQPVAYARFPSIDDALPPSLPGQPGAAVGGALVVHLRPGSRHAIRVSLFSYKLLYAKYPHPTAGRYQCLSDA